MFVALSQFTVRDGMAEEVRRAFERRPRLVEHAEGFVKLEVLRPAEDPNEFWLLTYWADAESFQRWHRSHRYKESHAGIPRGLKLVPGRTRLRYLSGVAC